jgi:hypothetical protein
MNARVDVAEQIKWWDALDTLAARLCSANCTKAVQMARGCRHPDAQWLLALLPRGEPVTLHLLRAAVNDQTSGRGLYLAWELDQRRDVALLQRAAEMGYARAQAFLSSELVESADVFRLAQSAADGGDRDGLFRLANCFYGGVGCAKDETKAIELFRQSAELELGIAQHRYGELAFGELDWERHMWWGRAAVRGVHGYGFCTTVISLLPSFEKFEHGRILHTAAQVVKENLNVAASALFGVPIEKKLVTKLQRVLGLHNGMLRRAKLAISSWLLVARRLGVAKDVRLIVAKMAWEEPWQWGEKQSGAFELHGTLQCASPLLQRVAVPESVFPLGDLPPPALGVVLFWLPLKDAGAAAMVSRKFAAAFRDNVTWKRRCAELLKNIDIEAVFAEEDETSWMAFYRRHAVYRIRVVTVFSHHGGTSISGDFSFFCDPRMTVAAFVEKVASHPENRQRGPPRLKPHDPSKVGFRGPGGIIPLYSNARPNCDFNEVDPRATIAEAGLVDGAVLEQPEKLMWD